MTKLRLISPQGLWLLICLLLVACQSPIRTEAPSKPPLLILVSIDGFRPDYLERGLTPNLQAIIDDGARARALRPSFPSLTFPNHYTLVTGLVPDHHGLINNTMVDPEIPGERFTLRNAEAVSNPAWWDDAQPLWNTARKAGLRSATMFWPGSEAPIHGHHPDLWRPYDGSVTPSARVQQVLDWIDLAPAERPDFITLYFDEVDHEGHAFGPDSNEVNSAIQRTDTAIGELLAGLHQRGLWSDVNLVIVSDHGMAATPAEHIVELDAYVPRKLYRLVTVGSLVGVEPRKDSDAARQSLDKAFARAIPHAQCWRKGAIPARFHYGSHRRIPRWTCLADEGWAIMDQSLMRKLDGKPLNRGGHGYDPALDSMAAIFIAHGPAFRPGAIVATLDNVDVYPLMARLLDITPEANDGDPKSTLPLLRAGDGAAQASGH
ncbi:MAG TPA: ectonucleotide pyrophosphatase/phosphodiesterase [Chiayiivirga sp.]|nr:ectonucleotide pyrophosphatase/phosphodiesterase [Chiayiivirga sp.]